MRGPRQCAVGRWSPPWERALLLILMSFETKPFFFTFKVGLLFKGVFFLNCNLYYANQYNMRGVEPVNMLVL